MECPGCKTSYKFSDVPFELRNMKFLITEFVCPYCGVWLRPDKKFKYLIVCFYILILLSIFLVILGFSFYPGTLVPGAVLFALSIIVFIVANLTLNVEIIQEE